MPVFLRTSNLKFAIRTNDHPPAHVHVLGPGAEAKIDLKSLMSFQLPVLVKKTLPE